MFQITIPTWLSNQRDTTGEMTDRSAARIDQVLKPLQDHPIPLIPFFSERSHRARAESSQKDGVGITSRAHRLTPDSLSYHLNHYYCSSSSLDARRCEVPVSVRESLGRESGGMKRAKSSGRPRLMGRVDLRDVRCRYIDV